MGVCDTHSLTYESKSKAGGSYGRDLDRKF